MVGGGMLLKSIQTIQDPGAIATVGQVALWAAAVGLVTKELLFRYLLSVAKRVKSGMLVANAWHARSDAASSLVVGFGIFGNLAGYPILDPIAALIVGLMIIRLGANFGWEALHDLVDRAADDAEVTAITETLCSTPGVREIHDLRTRKMGDLIQVDVHLSVDAHLTVAEGHEIAVDAMQRTMARHRVLNVMTHLDPWLAIDRD
jgi:cation diffusion facilitator family transporter